MLHSHSEPYPTTTPANGWAEQSPADWWAALSRASRAVAAEADAAGHSVQGVSFATTTCTLLLTSGSECD